MRRIQFDPEKCTGCAACQMACNDQRDILSAEPSAPSAMEQREKNGKILDYSVGASTAGSRRYVPERHFPERAGYVCWTRTNAMGCGACQKAALRRDFRPSRDREGHEMRRLLGQNSGGIAASLRPYLPHRRIDADGLTSKLRKTPETVVVSGAFLYGLEP